MSAAFNERAVEKGPLGRINVRLIPGAMGNLPWLVRRGASRKDEQRTQSRHHLQGQGMWDRAMSAARYPCFFTFAHRFFAAATILARASGLMTLLALAFGAAAGFCAFAVGAGAPFFRAAQRAFIAAANLARPSGVIPRFFFAGFILNPYIYITITGVP